MSAGECATALAAPSSVPSPPKAMTTSASLAERVARDGRPAGLQPRAARALLFDDGGAAVGAEPGGGIRERRQGVGQGMTGDERGGANGHASRCQQQEEFPVAFSPVTGEGSTARRSNPT